MCWLARAEQPRVAIEVVIKFDWTNNCRINDSARRAVATAVGIRVGGREEYDFVVFANDNKCNFWSEAQSIACGCGDVGRSSLETQGTKMWESRTYLGRGRVLRQGQL